MGTWRKAAVLAAVVAGLLSIAPVAAGQRPDQQQMLDAVRKTLQDAHVQAEHLPKRIISVQAAGTDTYKVHIAMVEGDGWFELKWDGQRWQVRGINPPAE